MEKERSKPSTVPAQTETAEGGSGFSLPSSAPAAKADSEARTVEANTELAKRALEKLGLPEMIAGLILMIAGWLGSLKKSDGWFMTAMASVDRPKQAVEAVASKAMEATGLDKTPLGKLFNVGESGQRYENGNVAVAVDTKRRAASVEIGGKTFSLDLASAPKDAPVSIQETREGGYSLAIGGKSLNLASIVENVAGKELGDTVRLAERFFGDAPLSMTKTDKA